MTVADKRPRLVHRVHHLQRLKGCSCDFAPAHAPRTDVLRQLQDQPVQAIGASARVFLPAQRHGLIQAVHTAYALHYPLVLSPDAIWLAIAQGFALHVNLNAERLRGKFVRHEGKPTISIRRDDFVKGSPHNPWPEVLGEFSDAVAAHVGRQRDLVVCDFTTTGPCERAASEVVLLDALQSYFGYDVVTLCGIPEITLVSSAPGDHPHGAPPMYARLWTDSCCEGGQRPRCSALT